MERAVWADLFKAQEMVVFFMHVLLHWFAANENALAVIVTVGVAILLLCCMGCSQCACRDKDEIFRRRQV
jgi:hypothetical protein